MLRELLPGIRINLFLTLLVGVIYPLSITGISQVLFPYRANGSLIVKDGKVIGSELIGQNFTEPEYFQPRPSAAGNDGYDAASSLATNYGPTNQKLIDRVKASVERFRRENPDYTGPIPADLLTTSASGLDPHLSPDSAQAQAARVAKARGAPVDQVRKLIVDSTEGRTLGMLGEPRVNVLLLNLDLDAKFPLRDRR